MARVNKVKREICIEIVEENGGSLDEIENIVESQFEFLRKTMERGDFSQVRMPYLGKFYVKPQRLYKLNHAIITRRKV